MPSGSVVSPVASCQGRRFARTCKLVKFGSNSRKHSRRRLSLMPISALHGQQYGWIQLFLGRSLTKFSLAQFTNPFKFNTQIRRPASLSLRGVVANSSRISSPDVGTSPRSNLRPARSNCLSLRSSCRQHAPTRPRAFPCLASSVDRVGSVQNNPAPIGAATAHVAHSSPPICHRQPPRHSRRHQPFWWNPMPVSSIGIAHLSSSSSWSSQQSSASAP